MVLTEINRKIPRNSSPIFIYFTINPTWTGLELYTGLCNYKYPLLGHLVIEIMFEPECLNYRLNADVPEELATQIFSMKQVVLF